MTASFGAPVICPLLIGREPPLATLRHARAEMEQRVGRFVLVSGEAGIGKSRLITEVIRPPGDGDGLLLRGSCFESDRSSPYAPLIEVVRALIAVHTAQSVADIVGPLAHDLSVLLPELAAIISASPPPAATEPEQQKRRLFHALSQLLMHFAARAPLIVVLEDLHWSDDASLEFLRYFARRITTQPILLLATYRSDEVHPALAHTLAELDRERLVTELHLMPLTIAEIDAMLRAIFDLRRPVQADFLRAIAMLTEGNPFFIEEILKSLATSGDMLYADVLRDDQALHAMHIPRTILDAVQRRAQQIGPAARAMLALASVAGRRFDFALLQEVLGCSESELLACMKEVLAAQFVVEESADRFAFRHALTQQAIAAQLLARERQTLHRSVAEALERRHASALDAQSADLAYHFHEAGDWPKTLVYAPRAVERGKALNAPRAVITQLTRVLEAADHLGHAPSAATYRSRGLAFETIGDFARARADHEQALQISETGSDRRATWQSLVDLGLLWAGRDYEQTGVCFRRAVALAWELDDPRIHAHSLNRLGNYFLNTGQPTEGLQAHQEALGLFRALEDQQGIADTLDLLGIAHWHDADKVAAEQCFSQAAELFRSLGDIPRLISSLASRGGISSPVFAEMTSSTMRTYAECIGDVTEALHLARHIDWPAGQAYADVQLGFIHAASGDFGAALAHAREALRIATEIEHQQWIVAAQWALGRTYLFMLNPISAIEHLEAGLALAHTLGSEWWAGIITPALAIAYLLNHDLARAEVILTTTMPEDTHSYRLVYRMVRWARGELSLAQGMPERALYHAEALLSSLPGAPDSRAPAALLVLKGEALRALQRLPEAEEALEEAKHGALRDEDRPLLWRVHRSLGQVRHALKREVQAQQEYQAAREVIGALAETIDDAHLRAQFTSAALASLPTERPLTPRRSAKAAYGGLTARERDVAALIAAGKSNREIAALLFIGEGTVATHVGNALGKLDLHSRTQIAAWAIERGLTPSS